MDLVTIDFETYYDDEYSLSKMTTESYIRDPRFEVIGLSIKVNDGETHWYSGENPGRFLGSLKYHDKAILCHHTAFDGAILGWHFGIYPKFYFDTLSMSRPLHGLVVGGSLKALANYYGIGEKGDEVVQAKGMRRADFNDMQLAAYGSYCRNDTELTYKLYNLLKKKLPVSELMVIDQTIRMYTDPSIVLDRGLLEEHLEGVQVRKRDLLDRLATHFRVGASIVDGVVDNSDPRQRLTDILMSNDKFAAVLRESGVEPPTKISPRTGKQTWAFAKTDQALINLLEHPDENVQALVSARLGVKSTIEETRTENLLGVAARGKLPIMLNYYGAHTGRFSGGDKLNLQNLPKRGNISIRKALCAPDGCVLIACDSSQIEARIIAWLAGQEDLVEAFRLGRDIYSEFASEIYGRTITKADKVERFVGKTCILGLGYGMGAEKFQRTLQQGQGGISVTITLAEAQKIVQMYRNKYWRIVKFWQTCGNALTAMTQNGSGELKQGMLAFDPEGITLPNGLKITYPLLRLAANTIAGATSGFVYCANPRVYNKIAKQRVIGGDLSEIQWTYIYAGKVAENVTQALAALIVRDQMVIIGGRYKVAFQVHDENIACVPEAVRYDAEKFIVQAMSTPPRWAPDLPIACEAKVGANYGACA